MLTLTMPWMPRGSWALLVWKAGVPEHALWWLPCLAQEPHSLYSASLGDPSSPQREHTPSPVSPQFFVLSHMELWVWGKSSLVSRVWVILLPTLSPQARRRPILGEPKDPGDR